MYNKDNKKTITKYLAEEISFNEFVNAIKTNEKLFAYLIKKNYLADRIKKVKYKTEFEFIDKVGLYCSINDAFFKEINKNSQAL